MSKQEKQNIQLTVQLFLTFLEDNMNSILVKGHNKHSPSGCKEPSRKKTRVGMTILPLMRNYLGAR